MREVFEVEYQTIDDYSAWIGAGGKVAQFDTYEEADAAGREVMEKSPPVANRFRVHKWTVRD